MRGANDSDDDDENVALERTPAWIAAGRRATDEDDGAVRIARWRRAGEGEHRHRGATTGDARASDMAARQPAAAVRVDKGL